MVKKLAQLFFLTFTTVALSSCGSNDLGGGIGEFATVNATAAAKTARLESDIVTGNACTTVSTGGTIETDNVDVDFTSTPQFTTGALNLVVSRITVHYIPANSATPAISDTFLNTNQTVLPGTTFKFVVPVLTEAQKTALLNRTTSPMPLCGSTLFEYYVDIVFETSEPGGIGKTRNITAKMNLALADRT